MRCRVIGLLVATATLAGAGWSALAVGASPSAPCATTFHVAPGVGSTFVSRIHVRGVTCAKAHFAIGRYERSLRHTTPFRINRVRFHCTHHTISRELGLTNTSCAHGSRRVSWRSAYGV